MELQEKRRAFKDIFLVGFSNIIGILCSLLTGFVIPHILGVQEYGYFKTFTLYAGYIGLFHFGFCDGIQLIFAGKRYDELNKRKFVTYTRFFIIFETAIALVVALISLFALQGNSKFIFLCIAINLILQNVMTYYQYVLQCTQRFKEYSFKNIVYSMLTAAGVVGMWVIYKYGGSSFITFKIYVLILLAVYFIMTMWFALKYRDITFGKGAPLKESWPGIRRCFILGFPLLIANLCSGLILNFDSQFVNLYFSNETYAIYAFAYSVLGMVTRLISAITIVIYPILKNSSLDKLKDNYHILISILLVFVFGCLSLYYPLVPIIHWFLPKYAGSLAIFRIILPGLALSSVISAIIQNYYKSLGKPGLFFAFSAITLAVSIGLNFAAYYLFRTTEAISWASIITLFLYYFLTQGPLVHKIKVKRGKNTAYMSLMMASFYLCFLIQRNWLAFVVYIGSFFLLTFSFFESEIVFSLQRLKTSREANRKSE